MNSAVTDNNATPKPYVRFLEATLILSSMGLLFFWIVFSTMSPTGKWLLAGISLLDIIALVWVYRRRYQRYQRSIDALRGEYSGSPHKVPLPGIMDTTGVQNKSFQPRLEQIDRLLEEDTRR